MKQTITFIHVTASNVQLNWNFGMCSSLTALFDEDSQETARSFQGHLKITSVAFEAEFLWGMIRRVPIPLQSLFKDLAVSRLDKIYAYA